MQQLGYGGTHLETLTDERAVPVALLDAPGDCLALFGASLDVESVGNNGSGGQDLRFIVLGGT
jgi:hypothetical protein